MADYDYYENPRICLPSNLKTYKVLVDGVLYGTAHEKFEGESVEAIKERTKEQHGVSDVTLELVIEKKRRRK
jgi:hypothetical protein